MPIIIITIPFSSLIINKNYKTRADKESLDTIDTVELDNLIGELDQFQKEHEAKERERQARTMNGHGEYPKPPTQTQTNHNDSIISTSTTITHAFSDPDKQDKVSLSASLNFSITSNASMTNTTLSDLPKFNCSDSEKYWNDNNNDLSADTGFENPSFVHLNDTNIVVMRDNDFPDDYYAKNAAEIVVLRCKDNRLNGNGSNNNSITDLNMIDSLAEQKQRLSSFRAENNNAPSYMSVSANSSPSHFYSLNTNINNNNSIPGLSKSIQNSFASSMYGQVDEPPNSNAVNVNNNVNVVASNKPAITPRPASLLSGTVESLNYTILIICLISCLMISTFVFIFYQFMIFYRSIFLSAPQTFHLRRAAV